MDAGTSICFDISDYSNLVEIWNLSEYLSLEMFVKSSISPSDMHKNYFIPNEIAYFSEHP